MLLDKIARPLGRKLFCRCQSPHPLGYYAFNNGKQAKSISAGSPSTWRGLCSSLAMVLGGAGTLSLCMPNPSKCDVTASSCQSHLTHVTKALAGASPRCRHFVAWVLANGFEVVVFDMDLTMGSGHCGYGIKLEDLDKYISGASPDFVEAVQVLSKIPGVQLAVATNSDPAEYDLPGQSRKTHILGPDLAKALISHWCPDAVDSFSIMVGFDHDCHKDVPLLPGKSWHMRRIAEHCKVPFSRMVLIDDSASRLANNDGWRGVLVRDHCTGFHFEDCLVDDSLPAKWRVRQRAWREPFMRDVA
eukprot:TRINITY_DN107144_c0_g1_i1.p1 TRINITY_DN107144_c0_g1~~TRINITY_DN107144_c0_g1_i1.p1  ORF type:complete len:302 (+),score=40.93 TRINITY_DN107144_c0_g1_i1:53-958(+)